MKTSFKNLFYLPALIAGLGLIPAGRVIAQTFTTLHSFSALSGSSPYTNSDGASPDATLILSGNTLYGTAPYGGSFGKGTVFAVNIDGTGFTILHTFTATSGFPSFTNSDGATPLGGLILSGNTLYGTAVFGGSSDNGTVFKVNTDGTAFSTLHRFTSGSDGAHPIAGLVLSGNTLYGTAGYGGHSDNGTVFKVNTDGTGFTNLHSFTALIPYYTNSFETVFHTNCDGAFPQGGLILSGDTLYGTANEGGSSGGGTVFAINADGTGFTTLHSFSGSTSTNSDGANPVAGLILSGNTLYGTTPGTVFALNTGGTGFTNLYSFTAGGFNSSGIYTNCDGASPQASLILSGNTLYGTAERGGSSGSGTVFAVNTAGTGFTNLHTFMAINITNSGGAYPYGGLVLSGNTLYGTAFRGGSSGAGTVFSLSFAPQLTITPSGANVILMWLTNAAGFDYTGLTLQSTTNLVSPELWTTVSPGPVIIGGKNTVTNLVSGTQQFFRLSQ